MEELILLPPARLIPRLPLQEGERRLLRPCCPGAASIFNTAPSLTFTRAPDSGPSRRERSAGRPDSRLGALLQAEGRTRQASRPSGSSCREWLPPSGGLPGDARLPGPSEVLGGFCRLEDVITRRDIGAASQRPDPCRCNYWRRRRRGASSPVASNPAAVRIYRRLAWGDGYDCPGAAYFPRSRKKKGRRLIPSCCLRAVASLCFICYLRKSTGGTLKARAVRRAPISAPLAGRWEGLPEAEGRAGSPPSLPETPKGSWQEFRDSLGACVYYSPQCCRRLLPALRLKSMSTWWRFVCGSALGHDNFQHAVL